MVTGEVGQRIRQLREAKGWSLTQLSKESGIERSSLRRYEEGVNSMSIDVLPKIAGTLGVTVQELYGIPARQAVDTDWEAIPILGQIPAGELRLTEENVTGYFPTPSAFVKGGIYFYLRVTGDCMADVYRDGDLALVRVQPEVDDRDVAVVVVDNEDATLKRYFRHDGIVTLKPENPAYNPIALPVERVRVIGKVVGLSRFDKNRKV